MANEEILKTCTLLEVPEEKFVAAAIAAVGENPANAPNRTLPHDSTFGVPTRVRMAVLTRTRWKPGRTLRAKFMGGHPRVHERLIPFARRWEDHANFQLDFVAPDADAEIRIAFEDDGSWSYLGTDALVIGAHKATMNYGWLTPDGPDDEYRRVVLHEFGHALGAIHEHSHPQSGIPWDRPRVYQYYAATQGWTHEEVDQQVFARYSQSQTNFSAYDRDSIMHYPVDNALTIGDFEIGWNRDLSSNDKSFIATIYPSSHTENELRSGVTAEGSISRHGEIDTFVFEVPKEDQRATLETSGSTDLVMSLHGPDDSTRLVAWDDDGGQGLNPRIAELLGKGRYWVRVEHWHPQGTGAYRIDLRLDEP